MTRAQDELHPHVQQAHKARNGSGPATNPWPEPLGEDALIGLAGDMLRAVEPHTEADGAAILLQFLTHVGNAVGRTARFTVENTDHYLNLFTVIAGPTAAGRKGSSLRQSRRPLELSGMDLGPATASGLSSGEGLIAAVRDPVTARRKAKQGETGDEDNMVEEVVDRGVDDKRLLVTESEFAAVIARMGRQGNVLSAVLRQAWDGETLRTLTKGSPAQATGAHISLIGHVTAEELRRDLSLVDAMSGFGNRILWCCAQRSQLLPDGGGDVDWDKIPRRLVGALSKPLSGQTGVIDFDPEARERWWQEYEQLTAGDVGLVGAVTSRAEAQVRRISTIYAVLDRADAVRLKHLEAGLEVWRYCRDSAAFLFGGGTGDPVADQILDALQAAGDAGVTRTEIRDLFQRNERRDRVQQALTVLVIHGKAGVEIEANNTERWRAR